MSKLRVLDLFSGIGGFSLGLERTGGFETVAFCEIEEFPRRVLAKHWPKVPCYHDVRTLTADVLRNDGIAVDVICGGFPCQDLSVAGKKLGLAGERSGLWSEIDRLVGELRPKFLIVENVANLLAGPSTKPGGWFGRVLGDLAERRYNAEWRNIPAWVMGRPHERERVWIVAYPEQERWEGVLPNFLSKREAEEFGQGQASIALAASSDLDARARRVLDSEPLCFPTNDGVPDLVAKLGACGNAVVPQIPEFIGRRILERIAA
ncbi:DNA cytosine methyltransferase [Agrobacterium sp. ST15.13.015]|uniref:DNA cytosine methyltransferase n=1 Tax=Agrobacterium sp. ST15.13.015 TaxID=3017319 RepID=UPI0022C97E58|nr:DNA (cytosine-5-)-methyltransferase [Agrobacterium sp. ST15.13.015]MCZ7502014.1 DNA (cytosine-5-)-methyltransferase [Rhizobium rhizogenes]